MDFFFFIDADHIFYTKAKDYHIHQTNDNYKCFHCDAIGSQKIYKSVERCYFLSIPTPIRRTIYFTRCCAEGCFGETEFSSEQATSMQLSLYAPLDKHS